MTDRVREVVPVRAEAIAGFLILAGAVPAVASGGLSCDGDDASARFLIESGLARSPAGQFFNFRGSLALSNSDVPADLREWTVTAAHLAHSWLDATELRLELYRERDGDKPHGYVHFVIRAKTAEEGSYAGRYELTVFDTGDPALPDGKQLAYAGAVSCFVE